MRAQHPILYQVICYNLDMNVKKVSNYSILGYILVLVVGFFYVRSVMNSSPVKQVDKEKEVKEVHPVKVYLNFEDKKLSESLTTGDSVGDFLDTLRDDNLIFFERVRYTYGISLDNVNRMKIPDGYEWRVYSPDGDITFDIDNISLVDNMTYDLRLVKK